MDRSDPVPMTVGRVLWITLILTLVGAGELVAQVRLEIAPQAALYLPTTHLAEIPMGFGPEPDVEWRNARSGAVGSRLTAWLGRRFGIEAAILHVPTSASGELISTGGVVFEPGDVRLLYATLRGLIRWGDVSGTTFHLALGAGHVDREGEGYGRFTEISDLALLGGVGVTVPMGGILALRWDLEDHVSRARFEERGLGDPVSLVQHDLALSMSLVARIVTF